MELTEAIKTYATERIMALEKFCERYSPCDVALEVGQTSKHHQKGDIFRAEATVAIPGATLRAESTKDDLYAAIDDVKDELKRQLIDRKER